MELLPNYYEWIYGKFRRYLRGDVMELGCGSGIGISTYLDQADRVYAVDYNEELVRRVGERFPSPKVIPVQADLLGDWKFAPAEVDAVTMMDVLEHFADDRAVAAKARDLLKPNGHLLVKVPAQTALFSSLDSASGHFRRYDPDGLRNLLESVGLETVSLRKMNPVGAVAYRMKNGKTTNFSRTFTHGQLRLINLSLPVLSWFDHLPWLDGLSLAGVFRKPG
jgi:SAM-dependent methyltransferase